MKLVTRRIALGVIAAASLVLSSCDFTADQDKEWGFPLVYMPQAVVQNGLANNNYVVPWPANPSQRNEFNRNYSVDTAGGKNNINVVLGVYRAGLQKLEAYNVDVVVRQDTASHLISSGELSDALVLPTDAYTLPNSISVPDGERETTFHLTIDRSKLLSNYPSYVGKRLFLAVAVANPSNYELNRRKSTTIVILNADWDTLTEE